MSQSPPGYIPISVNDRYTAPPRRPDRVIGVELYLVACPPHPLDIGMYVHAYYVPEADARHYFPTTASRRPWRVASRMWGRLVGVCLQPGDRAVFEMEICNPESQIRLAHLHVDVYPGLTIDRRRWCSLMVAQLCRRLCGPGCRCHKNLSGKTLDDILSNDPVGVDPEDSERWDDTYQVWATDHSDREVKET